MIIPYKGKTPEVEEAAFVADNAVISGDVTLRKNSSVWFGAVIRGDGPHTDIGEETNIQDGCILHADPGCPLIVGKGVTVGHAAILHGCQIGDSSLIGMGAILLDGSVIGKNCIVGANSLVTGGKVFEDGMLILGSPAKAVRKVTEAEIAHNRASAAEYVEKGGEYRKVL